MNTQSIINNSSDLSAAQLCAEYKGGNYGDWYLPSKHELNVLYSQKGEVGGFLNNYYWNSNEDTSFPSSGNMQNFSDGKQHQNYKADRLNVRAIRKF